MSPNPLPQSDAYANTLRALGTRVRIDVIGDQGRCLIQTRRIPLLGSVNLISRGPVGLPKQATADYLRALAVNGPLILNTDSTGIPTDGYLRLSAPKHLALLSLSTPVRMRAALHQTWRNSLKRAERSNLRVVHTPYSAAQHAWLIDAENEQQKTNRYRNWPPSFLNAFARENPGQARVVTAWEGKAPVAAMMFLLHRPWATYHLGVTTDAGRRSAAHNLTLWNAMLWLSARGYTHLDLGLLTGPDGLDRFKRRTGAHLHQLGGTWLRYPRPFRRQFPSIQTPSGQNA